MAAAEQPNTDDPNVPTSKSAVLAQKARHRLRNIGAVIASAAAIGAIASGLLGYWTVWKALRTDVFHKSVPEKPIAAKPTAAPRLSLVVLPFANNGDPALDYFVDAITDDLSTDLARIPGAFVIGRGTAFTYKSKAVDLRNLGTELGVRWAVQGSVRRTDELVRVNVSLTDLTTGADVWSDRFDGSRTTLATLQDEITRRLARSLDVGLFEAEGRRADAQRGRNPDAMDYIMRGWAKNFEQPRSAEKLAEARKLFEEARRLEPENVDAAIGIAFCATNMLGYLPSRSRGDDLVTARELTDFAILKRPYSAMAHTIRGEVSRFSGRPESAIEEYDIALGIDPNLMIAHLWKGAALIRSGRASESVAEFQTLMKLSPKDPATFLFYYWSCEAHTLLGNYDRAIDECKRSISLNSQWKFNYGNLAASYALSGRLDEARELVASFRRENPGWTIRWATDVNRSFGNNEQYWRQFNVVLDAWRAAGVPEN